MISKEKFNELNSEKKKIYYLDYGLLGSCSVKELDFSKRRICGVCANYFPTPDEELEVHDYCNMQNDSDCDEDFVCYLKDCYETQEDAEFAEEFKNIEHTETLDLPLFDYLPENFDISFVRFDKEVDCWIIYELYIEFNEIYILFRYVTEEVSDCIFREPLTKENYLEACKMVKKLFLGGKMYD